MVRFAFKKEAKQHHVSLLESVNSNFRTEEDMMDSSSGADTTRVRCV